LIDQAMRTGAARRNEKSLADNRIGVRQANINAQGEVIRG
jgi:hypothetical protein